MGMPVIDISPIDRDNAINNIIASIALQEAGLSHILNAEGEKIEKMAATTGITPEQLLAANSSVGTLIDSVQQYEGKLADKLGVAYTGVIGATGAAGLTGPTGSKTGASAYDIWLSAGFTGTEPDFLASLYGPTGVTGPDGPDGDSGINGATGAKGDTGPSLTGESAYDIWLGAGHSGGTGDFLSALDGPTGSTGSTGSAGSNGPDVPPLPLSYMNGNPQAYTLPAGKTGITLAACTNGYVAVYGLNSPGDFTDPSFSDYVIASYPGNGQELNDSWTVEFDVPEGVTAYRDSIQVLCATGGNLNGGE
jgi:hypothetical protein